MSAACARPRSRRRRCDETGLRAGAVVGCRRASSCRSRRAGACSAASGVPDSASAVGRLAPCSTSTASPATTSALKTGGLALDALDLAHVSEQRGEWEKVVRKIRTGAMPPAGRAAARQSARRRASRRGSKRSSTGRRSSIPTRAGPRCIVSTAPNIATPSATCWRSRSIAASLLPADNAAYGFDNNADALSLSPALTERYLGAAAKISQMALGRVRGSPSPETVFVPTDRNQAKPRQRRSAVGIARRVGVSLLLSRRWRVPVPAAAEGGWSRRRHARAHRGTASA